MRRSWLIGRYVARTYAATAAGSVAGVVAIALVIDFADRAYSFQGRGWFRAVVQLYANLSAEMAYQVAPAALLLAAGITVSSFRASRELVALEALGVAPRRLIAVVLLSCIAACGLAVTLNELFVVDAARRAEEIKSARFRRAGDFRAYFEQRRWFRGEASRLYNIRGMDEDVLTGVTIYELSPEFGLARRIDAATMRPTADGSWRLSEAVVSSFQGGARRTVERPVALELRLPESPDEFRIKVGRPRQMGLAQLYEQIELREGLSLPTAEYRLELYNRIAYPFAAVPGALLAIRMALRRNRKGHLTAALAEGVAISLCVWALLTIFRALGLSGQLPPAIAAGGPVLLLGLAGLCTWLLQVRAAARPVPLVVEATVRALD